MITMEHAPLLDLCLGIPKGVANIRIRQTAI